MKITKEPLENQCNCPLENGVHKAWCRSNNEYEFYKCSSCGKAVVQYSMSFGKCLKCNKKYNQLL